MLLTVFEFGAERVDEHSEPVGVIRILDREGGDVTGILNKVMRSFLPTFLWAEA